MNSLVYKTQFTSLKGNTHHDHHDRTVEYLLIFIELTGLEKINRNNGWDFGDEVLKHFANILRNNFLAQNLFLELILVNLQFGYPQR